MSRDAARIVAKEVCIDYSVGRAAPVRAVTNVTLDVEPGSRFVILGPSGCGKSTILKAIAGFLPVSSGSLSVGGAKVKGPGPDRAIVLQEFDQLFPWLTVRRNIEQALRLTKRGGTPEQRRARTSEVLTMMGLSSALDKYPHQLSGGMKQRTAISRAFALGSGVLLMDEPFGALDAITRTRLQGELVTMWRSTGVTIVFITHSIQEAVLLGDQVMVLGGAPSTVAGIVDTSHLDDPDDPAGGPVRKHLRAMLQPGFQVESAELAMARDLK